MPGISPSWTRHASILCAYQSVSQTDDDAGISASVVVQGVEMIDEILAELGDRVGEPFVCRLLGDVEPDADLRPGQPLLVPGDHGGTQQPVGQPLHPEGRVDQHGWPGVAT